MKRKILSVAVALCGFVGVVGAKDVAATDSTLELAKFHASDVVSWDVVAKGMYEGRAADGSSVTIYTGTDGAKLQRSAMKRELEAARLRLDTAYDADASDKSLRALTDDAAFLEAEIERLTAFIDHNSQASGAKVAQVINDTTGSFCGWNTATMAGFEQTSFFLHVAARFNPFGGAGGPPYPNVASVFRQIFTRVESGGVPVSDVRSSYLGSQSLYTFVEKDYAASCSMRVQHAMSVQCVAGGPMYGYGITREQTCAGLNAGTPPVVTP